jgi:hypothetical protein
VVDAQGRLLGTAAFATTAAGYRQLIAWVRSFGELKVLSPKRILDLGCRRSGLA